MLLWPSDIYSEGFEKNGVRTVRHNHIITKQCSLYALVSETIFFIYLDWCGLKKKMCKE